MTALNPQTAADAAERCPTCAATAPYWRPDDRECEICLTITEVPSTLDELMSDAEDGYGADVIGEHVKHLRQKHALLVEYVGMLLADRTQMAAELEQVRSNNTERALSNQNKLLDHKDQVIATLRSELEQIRREREVDARAVRALTDATAQLWSVPVDDAVARDTLLAAVHDRADDLFAHFADCIGALAVSVVPVADAETS